YAAHNKVDNLIGFVDYNGQQIDGSTDQVLSLGNLQAKWEAFGWMVLTTDGNDMAALNATIDEAKSKSRNGIPIMVLMTTAMGKGVDFMEGTHKWHGVAPNDEELSRALAQLEETLGDY
ncbi:MAG: transketolase, partial [Bacteroidetes bacterium]|nr:transketolase [Bacteroidota bacterium]